MKNLLRETKTRGSFLFPFELYHTTDSLGTHYVSGHWHQDLEILHLQKGQIQLFINGISYHPSEKYHYIHQSRRITQSTFSGSRSIVRCPGISAGISFL